MSAEMKPRGRKVRATTIRNNCIQTIRLGVQTGPKWRYLAPGEDPDCRCPACMRFRAASAAAEGADKA
jgi:hypothetical protein